MPAITKSYPAVATSAYDPDSPITQELFSSIFDRTDHLREWLGAAFYSGAVQDHDHDGLNSKLIPVSPLSTKTVSGVTALDFTSADFDWTLYERYIIHGDHVTIATNARYFTSRLSTDGSTFLSGASDYDSRVIFTNSGAEGVINSFLLLTDAGSAIGNSSDYSASMTITIHTPGNTGRFKQVEWDISYRTSTAVPNRAIGSGFLKTTTSPLLGIRLRLSDDSNFGGVFRAYGIKI
jgi:hypothetical protein